MKKFLLLVLSTFLPMAILTILILIGVDIYLRKYTRYMETIIVPNVIGFPKDSALNLLKSKKLQPIIYDSTYTDKYALGSVINQYPVAGLPVKENRKVYLIVNASSPKMISLPFTKYSSVRDVIFQLSSLGINIDSVIYEPSPCNDCVLKIIYKGKEINEEDKIPIHSNVSIIAGKLDTTLIEVPNVAGLTLKEALDKIRQLQLSPGAIISLEKDTAIIDSALYIVINQAPKEGTLRNVGSPIDLFVSKKIQNLSE